MQEKPHDKFYIQSIHRALGLVDIIAQCGSEGMTLTELARASNLHISTAYRMLQNLVPLQYVSVDELGRYRLGLKLLYLGSTLHASMDIVNVARKHLVALRNETGETINLATLDMGETSIIYVENVEGMGDIKLNVGVGKRKSIHSTATGKVLVSGFTDEKIRAMMEKTGMPRYTRNTIIDMDIFLDQVHQVRENEYATDMQENEYDICCIATPVRDFRGHVVAAVSLSGLTNSITHKNNHQRFKDLAIKTARNISRELGYKNIGM